MTRMLCVGALLVLVSLVVVGTSDLGAADRSLTIKQIMGKLNKGPRSLTFVVGKELKEDQPDWSKMQEQMKTYVELAQALGDNEPRKGSKDSWEKLSKAFIANAEALDEAVKKKDLSSARQAHARLTGSCRTCHTAHKAPF
jgi:cytochrome c556